MNARIKKILRPVMANFIISPPVSNRFSIHRIENHHTSYLLLLTYYFTKNLNAVQGNSEKVRGKK